MYILTEDKLFDIRRTFEKITIFDRNFSIQDIQGRIDQNPTKSIRKLSAQMRNFNNL